jgi:hypothetical protein
VLSFSGSHAACMNRQAAKHSKLQQSPQGAFGQMVDSGEREERPCYQRVATSTDGSQTCEYPNDDKDRSSCDITDPSYPFEPGVRHVRCFHCNLVFNTHPRRRFIHYAYGGTPNWTGPHPWVFIVPCCVCVPACLASSNLACPAQRLTRRLATAGFHEIKLDGFRMLARRDGAGVRLLTRRGIDWKNGYPSIGAAVTALFCRSFSRWPISAVRIHRGGECIPARSQRET